MKRWRRRRLFDGTRAIPLTPAQVIQLRSHQDRVGSTLIGLFIVASFAVTVATVVVFASDSGQDHRAFIMVAVLDSVLMAASFVLVREGRERIGTILALVVGMLHVLWVCIETSAGVSQESLLFGLAMAPFIVIRDELPYLRMGLAAAAVSIYIAVEIALPDGSGVHPLSPALAQNFSHANKILAGVFIMAVAVAIQFKFSSARRILEGAARYGELRATTDELTGVYNRRPVIAQLGEWAKRGRGNYAIVLIDLDHFKTVNDEFGHDCGDKILKAVAETLRNHFRDSDMVSRWGGDEFLILIPGVRHADLVPILERLRRSINLIEKRCNRHVHTVTVSIGAAMGAIGQTPDECISAADHALYRAKEEGRDKVVAVGVSMPTHAQGRPEPDDSEQQNPADESLS